MSTKLNKPKSLKAEQKSETSKSHVYIQSNYASKFKKEKKHKRQGHKYKPSKRSKYEVYKNKTEEFCMINNGEAQDLSFGPALPPHILEKQMELQKNRPILPENISTVTANVCQQNKDRISSDDDNIVGPMPENKRTCENQIKLEERALQMKLTSIATISKRNKDINEREEWMLKLPEIGSRNGLVSLVNLKTSFYQGSNHPDFNNRLSWTKTPGDENTVNQSSKLDLHELNEKAVINYERERDNEQEKLSKKYKREESLLTQHRKKLQKQHTKKSEFEKQVRRPFTREIDLKLNKIDKNQIKQIVDKAKILNSKFASGQIKYL